MLTSSMYFIAIVLIFMSGNVVKLFDIWVFNDGMEVMVE